MLVVALFDKVNIVSIVSSLLDQPSMIECIHSIHLLPLILKFGNSPIILWATLFCLLHLKQTALYIAAVKFLMRGSNDDSP